MLIETKVYKTKTYSHCDGFLVDIIETPDTYDVYMYNSLVGIKELMFGLPKDQQDYETVLDLVERNLPMYIDDYMEEYL